MRLLDRLTPAHCLATAAVAGAIGLYALFPGPMRLPFAVTLMLTWVPAFILSIPARGALTMGSPYKWAGLREQRRMSGRSQRYYKALSVDARVWLGAGQVAAAVVAFYGLFTLPHPVRLPAPLGPTGDAVALIVAGLSFNASLYCYAILAGARRLARPRRIR